MPDDASVFDLDNALRRAMGDVSFLRMMLDEFKQMIPEWMIKLERAIKQQEMARLGTEAHQLKGSAGNLGAIEIATAAAQLEKSAQGGAAGEALRVLRHLEKAVERFQHHLARIDWTRHIDTPP